MNFDPDILREAIIYIVKFIAYKITPDTLLSLQKCKIVLITLRFLVSGSFLQVIRDIFLGFDKSTVRRV